MMTNRDRFRRAFSAVQAPGDFELNLEDNTMSKKIGFRKAVVTAACTILAVVGGGTAVYASNVGGIQRQIQVWLHGDQTTATMTISDNGEASQYTIEDENGNVIQGGGGVVVESDGTTRPVTEAEMEQHLNSPDVEVENGHVYLYYKDQTLDLTDKFDDDGLCYVTLQDGSKDLYVTVLKSGAFATSPSRYPQVEWDDQQTSPTFR